MGTVQTQGSAGFIKIEPELTGVVLRGCKSCGTKHPLAFKPQRDPAKGCPGCGADVIPVTEVFVEKAVVTGLPGVIANVCFWVARQLAALAKRI